MGVLEVGLVRWARVEGSGLGEGGCRRRHLIDLLRVRVVCELVFSSVCYGLITASLSLCLHCAPSVVTGPCTRFAPIGSLFSHFEGRATTTNSAVAMRQGYPRTRSRQLGNLGALVAASRTRIRTAMVGVRKGVRGLKKVISRSAIRSASPSSSGAKRRASLLARSSLS